MPLIANYFYIRKALNFMTKMSKIKAYFISHDINSKLETGTKKKSFFANTLF